MTLNILNPKPSLQHLHIWGCVAYQHIPIEEHSQGKKYEPHMMKGCLVGYEGDNGHIFKVWVPESGKVYQSRDVTFYEGDEPLPKTKDPVPLVAQEKQGPLVNATTDNNDNEVTV